MAVYIQAGVGGVSETSNLSVEDQTERLLYKQMQKEKQHPE